ncbi:hypothetical protein DFH07DRAFT_948588 [Mycena maculata]|uniref:Uncharacterized protein n=1 Tax=Mycena maculata TaxID=230809 RepID=A0AAD7P168_9AGAR|nr:hypothetical protein DFH07DRAFT_948588 [Mycena maculata]
MSMNPSPFDAISLTSPSLRDDPAFSRDPSVHHAHPLLLTPRRDVIRTVPENDSMTPAHLLLKQPPANCYTTSYASQSSLTLPSNVSSSSPMSPSSSTSYLSPPTGMPPEPKAREDPPTPVVASPLAETFGDLSLADRPMSPPPAYEPFTEPDPEPRPIPFRNDSAPELRQIDPPGLPHRSATAPIPSAPPPRRNERERRPQAYDLDRIDELDESNPLGVALHHEGPFQAIASVLKAPAPQGTQPAAPQPRNPRAPKLGHNGASLGISPGQVLPPNFQYYQPPPVQPVFRQDHNTSQASTSYLPPQPRYGQNNIYAPPNHDPRWQQAPPPPQPPFNPRASYIPPQTQYDPIQPPPANLYDPELNLNPSGHHASYSSEDNSDAYGGIEEDPTPRRRSAPPALHAQGEPYFAHQDEAQDEARRHSVQTGFSPQVDPRALHDPSRFNAGQNLGNMRHSPNGQPPASGFVDPRLPQGRDQLDAGQNMAGMRHSPSGRFVAEFKDPRLAQQVYPAAGFHPPQGSHVHADEHSRRRPASYQPTSTAHQNFNNGPSQQQHNGQHPMAEQDPRRRASYQPVMAPPPGAAPVDLGRQQVERTTYQQQQIAAPILQDRQQSIAPSIASTANSRRPQPQHVPKHLIMPTPLQQSVQLPAQGPAQAYPTEHYPPGSQPVRFDPSQQAQPTRAQKIQMVQDKDGGRQLLRKRSSVVSPPMPPKPPKAPPGARQHSYMEPPPTVPQTPVPRLVQQEKKRPKRLLSKRRTDL